MIPRVYDPDGLNRQASPTSTVQHFFEVWYLERVQNDPTRKPISPATIERRQSAVNWWTKIMATENRPYGPYLCEITSEDLVAFSKGLEEATYKRGPMAAERSLGQVTQTRLQQELAVVLAAAGPPDGRRVRAGFLERIPTIYVEPINCFPKSTWSWDEATRIASACLTAPPPHRWPLTAAEYNDLARATICWWFYTGHRATSYSRLKTASIIQVKPGVHVCDIRRSVKTGKQDRIPLHKSLHSALEALRPIRTKRQTDALIPWPIKYGAVRDWHVDWQQRAGLEPDRIFSPQAWRRLHTEEIQNTVYKMASRLASQSAGHSSTRTTVDHYSLDAARLNMPELFDTQLRLF